jgi:hypothetical protein
MRGVLKMDLLFIQQTEENEPHKDYTSQTWWCTPAIPAPGRLRTANSRPVWAT